MIFRLTLIFYRWLYFIEGGLTCIIALFAFYVVPDYPTTQASWLTAEEQLFAQKRTKEDLQRRDTDSSLDTSQVSGLVEAFTDLTVWWLAIAFMLLEISQSFVMFFPTVVATLGYSPSITLLLCVPPQILNVLTMFFVTRCVLCHFFVVRGFLNIFHSRSDMARERFWHTTGSIAMGVIGFFIASSTMSNLLRYMSL